MPELETTTNLGWQRLPPRVLIEGVQRASVEGMRRVREILHRNRLQVNRFWEEDAELYDATEAQDPTTFTAQQYHSLYAIGTPEAVALYDAPIPAQFYTDKPESKNAQKRKKWRRKYRFQYARRLVIKADGTRELWKVPCESSAYHGAVFNDSSPSYKLGLRFLVVKGCDEEIRRGLSWRMEHWYSGHPLHRRYLSLKRRLNKIVARFPLTADMPDLAATMRQYRNLIRALQEFHNLGRYA